MYKKTKKFFILKNLKSQYIEQAIFVLKEKAPGSEPCSDVVREAEQIIDGYLEKLGYNPVAANKKHAKKSMLLNLSVIVLVVAVVVVTARLFL